MNRTDKKLIESISTGSQDAFNYIAHQDDKRKARVKALMSYSFEVCSLFRDVWIADDRKACALVLYPDQKKATLKAFGWTLN